MPRVLIVDPDVEVQTKLREALRDERYEVRACELGGQAIAQATSWQPSVILMDLTLPDMRGLEVCKALKGVAATGTIPIMIVSASGSELDRVIAFELGAADYVTKPFSMRELALRVRRLVPGDGPSKPSVSTPLQFGSLRIDPPAHRAWVAGDEITLTALEFRLLLTLCQRRERVQTREALLQELWGHDAHVLIRTVDAYVKRLRHKLGAAGRYIDTVRGVGYRFTRERAPSHS